MTTPPPLKPTAQGDALRKAALLIDHALYAPPDPVKPTMEGAYRLAQHAQDWARAVLEALRALDALDLPYPYEALGAALVEAKANFDHAAQIAAWD